MTTGRPAGLLAGALVLVAAMVTPARGGSIPGSLWGVTPPDSVAAPPTRSEQLDSLNVGRTADRAWFRLEEQVEQLAGGAAAQVGPEGIVRPMALGGAGWGRLPMTIDGFPALTGVVHWDDPGWFPIRALGTLAAVTGPAAGSPGAGRALVAATRPGPRRPSSTVTLTGGSFGHRLAELDFGRVLGRTAVHADVASFKHDGISGFGPIDQARGFFRADFPLFGMTGQAGALLASGTAEPVLDGFLGPEESTDESRLTLRLARPAAGGEWSLSLLRETSRLELAGSGSGDFRLSRGRWWGRAARNWTAAGGATTDVELTGSLESRDGLLDPRDDFGGIGAAATHVRPLGGGVDLSLRLGLRDQDPTGVAFEPSARLDGGDRWWLAASHQSAVPAMLLHLDGAVADRDRTAAVLDRIERLEQAERTTMLSAGGLTGGRFRVGLEGALLRTADALPFLSLAATTLPLRATEADRWAGDLRATVAWGPRDDLDFGAAGGGAFFDRAAHPYLPRWRADGWVRLRRAYFQHDLDLSIILTGRLLGPRLRPDGTEYPAVLTGGGTLTAQVRTLTLFWRLENASSNYVETDLVDLGQPVPQPGYYSRIGATLRLLD